MSDSNMVLEMEPLTSSEHSPRVSPRQANKIRVDNVTMFLILQFCLPGDVLRVGLAAKWCQALVTRHELWSGLFLHADEVCCFFFLEELPVAKRRKAEAFLIPLVIAAKKQMSREANPCPKKNFMHIMRTVSFAFAHEATRQRTIAVFREEQIDILLWQSRRYFWMFFSIVLFCLVPTLRSAFFDEILVGFVLAWGLTFLLNCSGLTCTQTWGTFYLLAATLLALLWILASLLTVCCSKELFPCSYASVLVSVQTAVVATAICWFIRLYLKNSRKCTIKEMGAGCVVAAEVLLVVCQLSLVGLKLDGSTQAMWLVVWTPTWLGLCIGFLVLCLTLENRCHAWFAYVVAVVYLSLLVVKLDCPEIFDWTYVWLPFVAVFGHNMVLIMMHCRDRQTRCQELELLLNNLRDQSLKDDLSVE